MEQICYKLILSLTKQNKHLRQLAKELNINHMTISRALKKLEINNCIDFTKEGRNNKYFIKKTVEAKEYQKMAEHHRLIELLNKHPRMRTIIKKIQETKTTMAIIFGSYAKGKETKTSDIDIYIESTNKELKQEVELLDSKISIKQGAFNKQNLLIKEIIKNHIIIKGVEEYYDHIY